MKKLLTVLLVAAMVLGIVGTAFAATPSVIAPAKFSDIAGNDAEAAITLLGVKSIMKGDAGLTTVRPDSTISRVEFAAMIVRMLGKDTLATTLANIKPTTKDEIPAWGWGYVNLAISMGIMKGDPDGSFRANDNVTFAEALAMLERSIGQDKKAVGAWPTNYLVVAYDLDLIDGVDCYADVPATRGDVAIMMVNTMNTPKYVGVNQDTGNEVTQPAILAATTVEGLVTAVNPDANTITLAVVGDKTLATSVSLAGAAKFSELVNVNVKMVSISSKVVYIEVTDTANVITGTFDTVVAPTATDTNTYIKLHDGTKYAVKALDATVTGKLNTVALANWAGVSGALTHDDPVVLNLVDSKVVYVDINRVNMKNYTVKAAATTDADKINYDITFVDTTPADTASFAATNTTPVTIDGVAKTIADLKANDVVYVTTAGALTAADTNILSINAFRATIKGEVTAIKVGTSTTVTLKLADGTSKDVVLSVIAAPAIGDTVEYRLNKDGKARVVVGFSATANVAYVTDKYTSTNSTGTKYYAVLDQAGTAKTIEVLNVATYNDANLVVKHFVEFTTDASGKLNGITDRAVTVTTDATVFAVDAANGIVTVRHDTDPTAATSYEYLTFGVSGISVYQDNDDDTFTSIGIAGLKAGDEVSYQAGEYDLLVRNDQ